MGDEFLFGDTIASVDAFEGVSDVVDADGDELGLGKRTPSKEMPLTSSFTTSCGSPVDEFSVTRRKVSQLINKFKISIQLLTFTDNLELHSVKHCGSEIVNAILWLVMACRW